MGHVEIRKALTRLSIADFATLIANIEGATEQVPANGTVAERAVRLIEWAESHGGPGLDEVGRVAEDVLKESLVSSGPKIDEPLVWGRSHLPRTMKFLVLFEYEHDFNEMNNQLQRAFAGEEIHVEGFRFQAPDGFARIELLLNEKSIACIFLRLALQGLGSLIIAKMAHLCKSKARLILWSATRVSETFLLPVFDAKIGRADSPETIRLRVLKATSSTNIRIGDPIKLIQSLQEIQTQSPSLCDGEFQAVADFETPGSVAPASPEAPHTSVSREVPQIDGEDQFPEAGEV